MNKPLATDLRAPTRAVDERVRLDDSQAAGAARDNTALWAGETPAARDPRPGRFDALLSHARDASAAPSRSTKATTSAAANDTASRGDAASGTELRRARRRDEAQRATDDPPASDDARPDKPRRSDVPRDTVTGNAPARHARRAARLDDTTPNDTLQLLADSLNAAVPVTPTAGAAPVEDATDGVDAAISNGGNAGRPAALASLLAARLQGSGTNAALSAPASQATPAATTTPGDSSGSAAVPSEHAAAAPSALPAALAALLTPSPGSATPPAASPPRFATADAQATPAPADAAITSSTATPWDAMPPIAQNAASGAAHLAPAAAASDAASATSAAIGLPTGVAPAPTPIDTVLPAPANAAATPLVAQASDAGAQTAAALASTAGWVDSTRRDRQDTQASRDDITDVSGLGALGSAGLATAPSALATSDGKIATPPVHDAQFADAMGAKLAWIAERHVGHAEIALAPGSDGQTLNVRVHVAGEHVRAEFASADPEVRQAITAHLPRLRELLAERGFSLADAQVGSQRQSPESPRPERGSAPGDDDARSGEPLPLAGVRAHHGLLDAFA